MRRWWLECSIPAALLTKAFGKTSSYDSWCFGVELTHFVTAVVVLGCAQISLATFCLAHWNLCARRACTVPLCYTAHCSILCWEVCPYPKVKPYARSSMAITHLPKSLLCQELNWITTSRLHPAAQEWRHRNQWWWKNPWSLTSSLLTRWFLCIPDGKYWLWCCPSNAVWIFSWCPPLLAARPGIPEPRELGRCPVGGRTTPEPSRAP